MTILDLFCCQGGASTGYAQAFPGERIIGVDIEPQPLYPFEFHQADAMAVLQHLAWCGPTCEAYPFLADVRFIHASPPCQRYSDLARRNGNAHEWPDLVPLVRLYLRQSGLPWVIENVEGAPLQGVTLCGTMFPELRVLRHRVFETSFPVAVPDHNQHPLVFTHDKRKAHYGKLDQDTAFVQVTGGGNASIANKRAAMGVPWMTNHGANEADPAGLYALRRPAVSAIDGARMSTTTTVTVHCDVCADWTDGGTWSNTVKYARAAAREHGWWRTVRDGQRIDLCPRCKAASFRYETATPGGTR